MKFKELKQMNEKEREEKLKELKLELVKTQSSAKTGNSKSKEIKKIIARILTLNATKNGVENK